MLYNFHYHTKEVFPMAENLEKLQKEQEARSFVGKNGTEYVQNLATSEEREHFEGILYQNGNVDLSILSYMSSHAKTLLT